MGSGRGQTWNRFRDMRRKPAVHVDAGRWSFPATARLLSVDEVRETFASHALRHSVAFRLAARALSVRVVKGRALELLRRAQTIPLVALERKDGRTGT